MMIQGAFYLESERAMENQVYVEFTGTIRPTSKDCKPDCVLDEEVRRITGASVSTCGSPSRSFDDAMAALDKVVGPIGSSNFTVHSVKLLCDQDGWHCTLIRLEEVNSRTKRTANWTTARAGTGPHAICKAILKLNERIESGGW